MKKVMFCSECGSLMKDSGFTYELTKKEQTKRKKKGWREFFCTKCKNLTLTMEKL